MSDSDCRRVIVVRIAVVVAHDEQPAGVQIKAVDMTVGSNQVGSDSVRSDEPKTARPAQLGEDVGAAHRPQSGRHR